MLAAGCGGPKYIKGTKVVAPVGKEWARAGDPASVALAVAWCTDEDPEKAGQTAAANAIQALACPAKGLVFYEYFPKMAKDKAGKDKEVPDTDKEKRVLPGVRAAAKDVPVIGARAILGRGKIIGLSTHSLEQAAAAQNSGADYIGVGPVFSTPTKPGYKAVGLDLIKEANKIKGLPFVAIGGIDESNIDEVIAAGASRIAVVRAVCGAEDIREAAKRLKDKLAKI